MNFRKILFSLLPAIFSIAILACVSNNSKQVNEAVNAKENILVEFEKKDDFEERLKTFQAADFKYIYAARRKDGNEFDKDDKTFIKENTENINRRVITQDNKVFLAGSNFNFSDKNLENLKNRFNVEDYSKPIETVDIDVNTPANSSKNKNVTNNSNKTANKTK